jgi:ribosomal protein S17E
VRQATRRKTPKLMKTLKEQLDAEFNNRRTIVTQLNALTSQYIRQAGYMGIEARKLKQTLEMIEIQCGYLQISCNLERRIRTEDLKNREILKN